MRLWHQDLIQFLPRQQLLGQHRECCALRGLGWGKKHATVDYIFNYQPIRLFLYHQLVMAEMGRRNYRVEPNWLVPAYRGRRACPFNSAAMGEVDQATTVAKPIYPQHDREYLQSCLTNLRAKGVQITEPGQRSME